MDIVINNNGLSDVGHGDERQQLSGVGHSVEQQRLSGVGHGDEQQLSGVRHGDEQQQGFDVRNEHLFFFFFFFVQDKSHPLCRNRAIHF